jgi:hypothetical protein
VRRGRIEIVTVGLNPNRQLVGSDPQGGPYDLGLFIGTNGGPQTPTQRQLFVLCAKYFNAGQRGRLVAFRQYLTMLDSIPLGIGSAAYNFPLERPVVTPTWSYVDGNVLWGIRQLPPGATMLANAQNGEGMSFEVSQTPAQLFETIVGNVVTPPNGGAFPGNVLTPELGRFFELRCTDWSEPSVCDIPFEGPCNIVFMASVQQTHPQTRPAPPPTSGGGALQFLTTQGTTPEDAFLQNYPGSIYGRIAGALIFEMEEQAPTGSPKTYRRPGDGDRITRDTTEVGDNTMRRSAEDTSEYIACGDGSESPPGGGQGGGGGHHQPKRPASPPHPNAPPGIASSSRLAGLPTSISTDVSKGTIDRLTQQWRVRHGNKPLPLPERGAGLGSLPKEVEIDAASMRALRLLAKWRDGNGGPG